MTSKLNIIVLTLAAVCFCSVVGIAADFGTASGDTGPNIAASIVGKVSFRHAPVPGAIVKVYNARGSLVDRVMTDRYGEFKFSDLDPGEYNVWAAKAGMGEGRQRLDVRRGEITNSRIDLQ